MQNVTCGLRGCVVVALFSNCTSWELEGLKQQGSCKLNVGVPPPGSAAYDVISRSCSFGDGDYDLVLNYHT